MAFYRAHEAAYLSTDSETELAGFLLQSDTGQYFHTNAVDVPIAFVLQARIQGPNGWRVRDFLHTHPGGHKDQNAFSEYDRMAVLEYKRSYYLRTPEGDVRYMDRRLAKSTRILSGARGESVCPSSVPCVEAHPRHNRRAVGDWSSAIRRK